MVETRAYSPTRNIFVGLRDWPKTWSDLVFWEARLAAIWRRPIRLTEDDPFRLGEDHHTPARPSVSR